MASIIVPEVLVVDGKCKVWLGNYLRPSRIVAEVLVDNNYENWKIWLETYLKSKDLWDDVIKRQPQPDIAIEVLPQLQPEPNSDINTEEQPQPEPNSNINTEEQPQPEPNSNNVIGSEGQPQPQPQPEPNSDINTEEQPQPQPNPYINSEEQPQPQPNSDNVRGIEGQPQPEPNSDINSEEQPQPGSNSENVIGSEGQLQPQREPNSNIIIEGLPQSQSNSNIGNEGLSQLEPISHIVIEGQSQLQPQPNSCSVEDRAWQMKNAKALHAIQISCGSALFEDIKKCTTAREAWDCLARKLGPKESVTTVLENREGLPILTGNDDEDVWTQWKARIQGDFPWIVNPTITEPGEALEKIRESCGSELIPYIDGFESAKDAWDQLVTMHEHPRGMQLTSHTWCPSFYQALLNGDADEVNLFVVGGAMGAIITVSWDTPLHIAAQLGHEKLVRELVSSMRDVHAAMEIVKRKNKDGNTAFSIAVAGGRTMMAMSILERNQDLLWMRNANNQIPIVQAAVHGKKEMVSHLYSLFKLEYRTIESNLKRKDGATLLTAMIAADIFDLALDLLRCHPVLGITLDENGETALNALAKRPSAFPSGSKVGTSVLQSLKGLVGNTLKQICFQHRYAKIRRAKLINKHAIEILNLIVKSISISRIPLDLENALRKAVVQASMFGTVEVIAEIKKSCLHLLVNTYDEQRRSIFQVAIVNRQEKVFKLIHEMGPLKEQFASLVDNSKNSMLHLAAMLAPYQQLEKFPTAALQVQLELRWLKEVERIVEPKWKTVINANGETPLTIFMETHKDLIQEGSRLMHGMGKSSMLMATLIATVMFAAAFTIPGGNENQTGSPVILHDNAFMVFAISDAISLFSSIASVLMFLSILTSRYAVDDFLEVLPRKLIIGLLFLFIAVSTMMVAFSATLYVILHQRIVWITIPITLLASCPTVLSVILQLSHCLTLIKYTYFPSIFS